MSYLPNNPNSNQPYPPPIPGSPPYPGGTPSPYGYQPYAEPRRVSGVAVASLILSLIVCIPFLTSALAAVLGVVGIVLTGNPKRSGRLLAIFGLIIGVLGIVGWSALSYVSYKKVIEPTIVAARFQEHLRKNDISAAAALTAPPFDKATLPELANLMQGLGRFQTVANARIRPSTQPDMREGHYFLPFPGQFESGTAEVIIGMDRLDSGWKITHYDLKFPPRPMTRPTSRPWGSPGPGGPGAGPGVGGEMPPEVPEPPAAPAVP